MNRGEVFAPAQGAVAVEYQDFQLDRAADEHGGGGLPGGRGDGVGERDAFAFLRQSPLPGAVLAPVDLGMAVPAETGRNTWVGIFSWTPDFTRRTFASAELFAGDLAPGPARALVRSSGVRFLLSGCSEHGHLASALAPVLATEHHFGCATVYEVRPG